MVSALLGKFAGLQGSKTIKISLRPKPKKTANPLALPVSSRFQDGTECLKFQNLKPGWKAKSLAPLVYLDASGQTSLFSL